jgi:hypothetical protein
VDDGEPDTPKAQRLDLCLCAHRSRRGRLYAPAAASGGTCSSRCHVAQTDANKGVDARATPARTQTVAGGAIRIEAPSTSVNVDTESGKVHVQAPYTDVKVDTEGGAVRVRAPYVNLDVRW